MQPALLELASVRPAGAAAVSGTTQVDGTTIDTQGYDSILFVTTIPTFNAGNFIKAQQGDASNLSDAADLAGTKVTATADGMTVCLEIRKPLKRYIRLSIVRGVATATTPIFVLLVNKQKSPTSNTTSTLLSKLVVSPAAGTP